MSFAIAYRMLGSVTEAEDVVQEALLRLHTAINGGRIESMRAFLVTVTTRLAIDELRSARKRRERYTGEWLPEPILTDSENDPAHRDEIASIVGNSEDNTRQLASRARKHVQERRPRVATSRERSRS